MIQELPPGLPAAWLCCWLLSAWALRGCLPTPLALAVGFLRSCVPLVYFAFFYNPAWNFRDDLAYTRHAALMLELGHTPVTVLQGGAGTQLLVFLASGVHVLYDWWNLLAQWLFGPCYWAAVFLNVPLTCVAGRYLMALARLAGFGRAYAQGLLLFFLLHFELVVWSSLINLKDVLLLTLTLAALRHMAALRGGTASEKRRGAASLLLINALFLVVRFYLPVLLLAAFVLWQSLTLRGWKRALAVSLTSVVLAAFLLLAPGRLGTIEGGGTVSYNPAFWVAGAFRFTLTPQPWSLEVGTTFLLVPSVLHWLLYLPALYGAAALWRRSPATALLLVYALVTALFYSVTEYASPRQRLQLVGVWAWMEFHGLFLLLSPARRRPRRRPVAPAEPTAPPRPVGAAQDREAAPA